jgi:hypothetical protein
MDKEEFDKYLKERYEDQIKWYDAKSMLNQKRYRRLQWSTIILSALTPVLIAVDFGLPEYSYLTWISVVTAVIVAILTSALKTFNYHENWINYRTTCETLKKEIYLYNAGIGDYTNAKDKEALFVDRVESLISRENTLWITTYEKDRKDI